LGISGDIGIFNEIACATGVRVARQYHLVGR
jgi:hypothetical protein